MMVTPLGQHSSRRRVDFDSSYRSRMRSPDIAHRWKSYSPFAPLRLPHTTDSPGQAQLPVIRCRALSCKVLQGTSVALLNLTIATRLKEYRPL
jgi:hypothetical protein